MKRRFDSKKYQGKDRIFVSVSGCLGVQRIWIWNKERSEYAPPVQGLAYIARRYEQTPQGGRKRIRRAFETIDAARDWQRYLVAAADTSKAAAAPGAVLDMGPTFADVFADFWQKKVSKLSSGTQANYRRYIRLSFGGVMVMPMRSITSRFIDELIECWRANIGRFHQAKMRTNFKHELSVLRSVLSFYSEYYDDAEFRFPLKQRHARDCVLKKSPPKDKDFTEEEFVRFRKELLKRKDGVLMAAMATVQFYQALRVSEVGALRFEDLRMDYRDQSASTLRICQHVIYPRTGNSRPTVEVGFKNARGGQDSVKEQPLWPQSFDALKSVFKVGARGLIFGVSATEPFSYRTIQSAYDDAFGRAGLNYSGTHVLRHGGTRRVYNATGGDLAIAQQLLGNADLESTLVYAKRDKAALRNLVRKDWESRKAHG